MDSGVQIVRSPLSPKHPERGRLISPPRPAKLPPISPTSEEHPSSAFLQAANAELKEAMKHLLREVRMTERILRAGIVVRNVPTFQLEPLVFRATEELQVEMSACF